MQQTAVEFLYERLERMIPRTALYNMDKEGYFTQAKEMEKQQIIDAHGNQQKKSGGVSNHTYILTGEKYYEEIFKK
jgi:hypothetical protein